MNNRGGAFLYRFRGPGFDARLRSYFEILASSDESLTIADCGGPELRTVTNDAEAVVAHLLREGDLRAGQRLFYRDSERRLDELLHDGVAFTGFAPDRREEVAT